MYRKMIKTMNNFTMVISGKSLMAVSLVIKVNVSRYCSLVLIKIRVTYFPSCRINLVHMCVLEYFVI